MKPKKQFGRSVGCTRCGRRRGIIRKYGMHLCRHPDGRLDSDRRDRLALAGGTGSSGGPAGPLL